MPKKKDEEIINAEPLVEAEATPPLAPVITEIEANLAASATTPAANVCDCGEAHVLIEGDIKKLTFPTKTLRAKKSDPACVQKVANRK